MGSMLAGECPRQPQVKLDLIDFPSTSLSFAIRFVQRALVAVLTLFCLHTNCTRRLSAW